MSEAAEQPVRDVAADDQAVVILSGLSGGGKTVLVNFLMALS